MEAYGARRELHIKASSNAILDVSLLSESKTGDRVQVTGVGILKQQLKDIRRLLYDICLHAAFLLFFLSRLVCHFISSPFLRFQRCLLFALSILLDIDSLCDFRQSCDAKSSPFVT
eukprot:1756692-Rhodomonas_salina.2